LVAFEEGVKVVCVTLATTVDEFFAAAAGVVGEESSRCGSAWAWVFGEHADWDAGG